MAGRAAVESREKPLIPGPAVRFADTQASVLLDLLRGLAAVLVLLEHWRNLLFVDFRDVAAHRLLWVPAYVVSSCGIAAVMLFFVLSGYLVGGSALRMLDQCRWSWRDYMTHRLVRLWIVLVPVLLLCALLDTVGLRLPFAFALYHGLSGNHVIEDVTAARSLPVFLGNLFFLQEIYFPPFGTVRALWSLAYEFWYYLLFPAGLLVLRRGPWPVRVAYAAGFAGGLWFVGRGIRGMFPVWLMGVLLARVPPLRLGAGARWTAGLLYLLPFLTFQHWTVGVILSQYCFASLTTLLLYVMLSAGSSATGRPWERVARWLSSFSFTLYVLHASLLALLGAWFVRSGRMQPGWRSLPIALALLMIAVVAAYLLARVTEYRTNQVRLWVERRLPKLADGRGLVDAAGR